MKVTNELLLASGKPIPFPEGRLFISQPKIEEIAIIGDEDFNLACYLLVYAKKLFSEQSKDKDVLKDTSNFDIILTIFLRKQDFMKEYIILEELFLFLFPEYTFQIKNGQFQFIKDTKNGSILDNGFLDNSNFEGFQDIIKQIFCMQERELTDMDIDTSDKPMMERVQEKLKERKRKLAEMANDKNGTNSVFARYISILAPALGQDMLSFYKYTVYQLYDEFTRYMLMLKYQTYEKQILAGANPDKIDKVDDWMKSLHP